MMNRILFTVFIYLIHEHTFIPHTHMYRLHVLTHRPTQTCKLHRRVSNYISLSPTAPHLHSHLHMHSWCCASISCTFTETPLHLPPLSRNVAIWFPRWLHLHKSPCWCCLCQHWHYKTWLQKYTAVMDMLVAHLTLRNNCPYLFTESI